MHDRAEYLNTSQLILVAIRALSETSAGLNQKHETQPYVMRPIVERQNEGNQ